jgi:hypothetical protein
MDLYQMTVNFDGGNMFGPHKPIDTTNIFEAWTFSVAATAHQLIPSTAPDSDAMYYMLALG